MCQVILAQYHLTFLLSDTEKIRALLFVLLISFSSAFLSIPIFHNVSYLNIYEFILVLSEIFHMINIILHPLSTIKLSTSHKVVADSQLMSCND